MKWIALPRAGGKTHQLIQWLCEEEEGEHRIMIVQDRRTCERLERQYPELRGRFKTLYDVRSGHLSGNGGTTVLGIDNLDLCLSDLFGWTVGAASYTAPEQRWLGIDFAAPDASDYTALAEGLFESAEWKARVLGMWPKDSEDSDD